MRRIVIYGLSDFLIHYVINGKIFEEKLLNKKCAVSFALKLPSETFVILRGI